MKLDDAARVAELSMEIEILEKAIAMIDRGAAIASMTLWDNNSGESVTIPTEHLVHPPQMIAAIREQEIVLWQKTYDELAQLGVTNVPAPPGAAARR